MYIEREALLQDIEESVLFTVRPGYPSAEIRGANKITERIKSAPAADVVEVRHGEWIKNQALADVCAEYKCSLCGFIYCEADPEYPPYKYCPICGGKNE